MNQLIPIISYYMRNIKELTRLHPENLAKLFPSLQQVALFWVTKKLESNNLSHMPQNKRSQFPQRNYTIGNSSISCRPNWHLRTSQKMSKNMLLGEVFWKRTTKTSCSCAPNESYWKRRVRRAQSATTIFPIPTTQSILIFHRLNKLNHLTLSFFAT